MGMPRRSTIERVYRRFVGRLWYGSQLAYEWRLRHFATYIGRHPGDPMETLRYLLGKSEREATDLVNGFKPWLIAQNFHQQRGRCHLDGINGLMIELHKHRVAPWRITHPFKVRAVDKWRQCSQDFRKLAARWFRFQSERRPKTIEIQRTILCRLGRFMSDRRLKLPDITADHVTGWLHHLRDQRLSSTSVSIHMQNARRFFAWLRWQRVVSANPFAAFRTVRKPRRLPRILDPEQVEALLRAASDVKERALVELFYATGCTSVEASTLNIGDFSYSKKQVLLKQVGGQTRMVPISTHAADALQAYIETKTTPSVGDPFFINVIGNRWGNFGMRGAVRRLARGANLGEEVSPQMIRHSFGTHFIDRGGDAVVLKFILGQACFSATNRYRALATSEMRKIYNRSHPRR